MELSVTAGRSGRLSTFLKGELGLSTGLMNRLKWNDRILVNGVPRHADFPVAEGDVITALLDDEVPAYPAEEGSLRILYEDDHLLAVDKPAGILIHPSRSRDSGTLANYVVYYYQQTGQKSAFHPVTRLDRDTFGVVLLAKNAHVHAAMNTLHAQGGIRKTYHALVFGTPEPDSGTIDAPIARLPLPSLLRRVDPAGKPSVTEYRMLERRERCSLLELRPITGRTHQLRVHCAYMGFPILGDPQYGSPESMELSRQLGLESQLLCAQKLEFIHPVTGEPLRLESEYGI